MRNIKLQSDEAHFIHFNTWISLSQLCILRVNTGPSGAHVWSLWERNHVRRSLKLSSEPSGETYLPFLISGTKRSVVYSRSQPLMDQFQRAFGFTAGVENKYVCTSVYVFFSRAIFLCVLTFIRCPLHPHTTAVACKRPRSFYQKWRWQVTPKYAYTHDPMKSEWADYAAVQT